VTVCREVWSAEVTSDEPVSANARRVPSSTAAGPVAASVVSVAAVTAVVTVLAHAAPPISLGVVYLLAILPIAARFGLIHAVVVSLASMFAFNFFVLPPVYTLTLADSANWLALAVYLATSGVVCELAARDRRRAVQAEKREREAEVLADIATRLLSSGGAAGEIDRVVSSAAAIAGGHGGRIALDADAMELAPGETAYELVAPGGPVGALITTAAEEPDDDVLERFLPALASLLAVATDRARLTREAGEAELLRRSDRVKTTILRAVSHDLRSPLTAIRVAGEALRHRGLALSTVDRDELIDTILAEAARLDRIVGNLLDFSRLQVGAVHPVPELLTADGLIADALSELGHGAERVRVELAPALPLVRVDGGQIRRVLVNLLENALRHTAADELVAVRAEAAADVVRLAVVDHGPGIAAADRLRIFEPFARAGQAPGSGAGLGLAIARGFAHANGCALEAEDADAGSCFVLTLPGVGERP
jgi:two-component system sensor histidine kinase KdpD